MFTIKRNQDGFSLMELMVTISIVGISMLVLAVLTQSFFNQVKNTNNKMDRRAARMLGNELIRKSMQNAGYSLTYPHVSIPVPTTVNAANLVPGLYKRGPNFTWISAIDTPPKANGVVQSRIQFYQTTSGEMSPIPLGDENYFQTWQPLDHYSDFDSAELYAVWPLVDLSSEALPVLRAMEPEVNFELDPISPPISSNPCTSGSTSETIKVHSTATFGLNDFNNRVALIRNEDKDTQEFIFRRIISISPVTGSPNHYDISVSCIAPYDPSLNLSDFLLRAASANLPSSSWSALNPELRAMFNFEYFAVYNNDPNQIFSKGSGIAHSINQVFSMQYGNNDGTKFLMTPVELERIHFANAGGGKKNLVLERYNPNGNINVVLETNIPTTSQVHFARRLFTDAIEVIISD